MSNAETKGGNCKGCGVYYSEPCICPCGLTKEYCESSLAPSSKGSPALKKWRDFADGQFGYNDDEPLGHDTLQRGSWADIPKTARKKAGLVWLTANRRPIIPC